jgi:general secretion pathway protein E
MVSNVAIAEAQVKIPLDLAPLPISLAEKIAVNVDRTHAYVDRRSSGDPIFLTWIERNKANGISLLIKPCEVDELVKIKSQGGLAKTQTKVVDPKDDQKVRNYAIELLVKAASYNASDLHIMNRGKYSEIQIVVKGGLRVLERLTHEEGEAVCRAIYQGIAKTRDSSFNPLSFQNAQIPGEELEDGVGVSSVRIVRGPSYPQSANGSFMTARLQYIGGHSGARQTDLERLEYPRSPEGVLRLDKMGYTPSQIDRLKTMMDSPNGMVIFTGPTGSGKTTAMFECLQHVARTKPERRLVTVEDPVEYPMEWAVQMAVTGAVNDKQTGEAFGERVRVALRMAPNIILLGELRGPEVAVSALEASVTGHQVWTTMHVTDPYLFVERLELMDKERLDRKVFCDHKIVRGVVAQRLVPRVCPHCSNLLKDKPEALPKRIVDSLKTWGDISRVKVRGSGCDQCGFDGTLGRFAVAEVVMTDAKLMSDFIKHGSEIARKNHRTKADSDPSMLEAAIQYILEGEVDPLSVESTVDLIVPKGHEE